MTKKSATERIRNEVIRFSRRLPPIFGKLKAKKRWFTCFSKHLDTSVDEISGMLYVLGDSHTYFFGGHEHIRSVQLSDEICTSLNLVPFLKTFHLGPATAYNLANKDSKTKVWQKTERILGKNLIPRGSSVLLCFGEIDCRVHLLKQSQRQSWPVEDVIHDTITNYMGFVRWLKDSGFKVICWGAIATQKGMGSEKQEFPCYGSETERNKITRTFNTMLEAECHREQVGFCSIFDQLIDENMETLPAYLSSDKCHLSQRAIPLVTNAFLKRGVVKQDVGGRLKVN